MADIKVPHSPATTNTDIAAAFIESPLGLAPPVAPAAPDPRRLPQSFARRARSDQNITSTAIPSIEDGNRRGAEHHSREAIR
jgi:hypothetical protein